MTIRAQEAFALSSQQRWIWRASSASELRGVLEIALPPHLDRAGVRAAFERVVDRHEILRTRFVSGVLPGIPGQIVDAPTARVWSRRADAPDVVEAWFEEGDEPRMIVTVSALAADATTLDLIARALHAELEGRHDRADVVQYADYAGWHQADVMQPAPPSVQEWRPWPPAAGRRFHPRRLPADVGIDPRLEDWAARNGTRAADALLGAWAAFLWRLDPIDAIPIAVLMPGRALPELAMAIGPYDTYGLVSAPVAKTFLELIQGTPEARVAYVSDGGSSAAAAFVAREAPPTIAPLRVVDRHAVAHEVCVELDCVRHTDGWRVGLVFDDRCCSETAARDLRRSFARWVTTLLDHDGAPLDELPFGWEPAWGELAAQIAAIGTAELVPEMLTAVAKSHASETAVADELRSMTYAELDGRASDVAARLVDAGAVPGASRVAVVTARNGDAVVGALAALKAGVAYVPIDPTWPADRRREVARLTGVELAVVDQDDPALDVPTLSIGNATARGRALTCALDPSWTAYVLMTSGSAGAPRVVAVTHQALASYVRALIARLGVSASDRYLHTAALPFSASIRQLILPLTIGGRVVMASREALLDPAMLIELADTSRVTVLDLVPSLWWRVVRMNRPIGGLRLALSASEPFAAGLVDAVRAVTPGAALMDMYGLTEAAGIVTTRVVSTDAPEARLGTTLDDAVVFVLDRSLRRVLPGGIGEVHVARPGLRPTYADGDARTTFKTIGVDGGALVLVATGDLARVDGGNEIRLLGRSDSQVKIRGHRVELSELERCLSSHRNVEQVAVVVVTSCGEPTLAAHVVLRPGEPSTIGELLAHVEARLPSHFRPARLVMHDRLPVGRHGKLDRAKLAGSPGAREAPRTVTESRMTKLWQRVLGRSDIGPDDDFFALGGDSLRAIDLLAAVGEEFGMRLRWQMLFETSTVAQLAARIDEGRGA